MTMAKRRKPQTETPDLPSVADLPLAEPPAADAVEQETTAVEPVPEPEPEIPVVESPTITTSTIKVPRMNAPIGYARNQVSCKLNGSQAEKLKTIQLGLEAKGTKLANGRHVSTPYHAIVWMIEQA